MTADATTAPTQAQTAPASAPAQTAPASVHAQTAPASAPAQTTPASVHAQTAPASAPAQAQPESSSVPPQAQPAPAPASAHAQPPSQPHYSADGLYNLANSYARAGKAGLAVLNYKRALLLAPNDPDINANLESVRTSAHLAADPTSRLSQVGSAVSPTSAAWLGVLGIALVGAAILSRKLTPRFKWLRALAALMAFALIGLGISNALLLEPRTHEAVILVDKTPARVTPVPMGDTALVLKEAETVTLVASHEDFVLVRTRTGASGWVSRGTIGQVVP